MGKDTKIEWCDHTVNLWHGCAKVHTGCKNCYAEATAKRWGFEIWGEKANSKEIKSAFKDLQKYENHAKANGFKEVVFIGSMMDIFEGSKPLVNSKGEKMVYTTASPFIKLFTEITGGKYQNLIFLFLTKRPQNIRAMLERYNTIPDNCWFGTSISDQETADDLIPKLLKYSPPRANLFLSVEPQVGEISLAGYFSDKKAVDLGVLVQPIKWVIQGGESGVKRRPFQLQWAYLLKTQCARAGIPYFFKQIDKVKTIPPDLNIQERPNGFPL